MIRAEYIPYSLNFTFTAITSRQAMKVKDCYLIRVWDSSNPNIYGVGECALFRGLSADDVPNYEDILRQVCIDPLDIARYHKFSSICFGIETAMRDLASGGNHHLWDTQWSRGETAIPINGLIWMGKKECMVKRINEKLEAGFRCLKLKIGGINFDDEIDLLHHIRSKFPADKLELRLDANGSFTTDNALSRLERLSKYAIHSIEQPIRKGQIDNMAKICHESPIDIALDEELIGVTPDAEKKHILSAIKPRYIILKPSLCGGFKEADKWIETALELGINWWATSALESNIGLNAIAQWVSTKNISMVQGLGTGGLYSNNIDSPLYLHGEKLLYDTSKSWGKSPFEMTTR